MEALGYVPRFFKGSFLTFQRYGEFAGEQGFTSVTGASLIGEAMEAKMNEWGVDDDVLFRSVEADVPEVPTFNFIVSTTYHPPYDIDVFEMGYPVTSPPTDLATPCSACTTKFLQTIGHAWFADRALGDFVARTSKAHPEALFVITADHWSRRFVTERPTFELKTEIPLIMYGPKVLEGFAPVLEGFGSSSVRMTSGRVIGRLEPNDNWFLFWKIILDIIYSCGFRIYCWGLRTN